MTQKSITALADEVRRGLVDIDYGNKDAEFARALANVHDRSRDLLTRVDAAKRYRSALRAEGLDVGVLPPNEKKGCETGRQTVRRVATQLLSQEGQRATLLTSAPMEQALGAVATAGRTILNRANKALQDEQGRLRPPGIDQPLPEVPGAQRIRVELLRYQQRLQASVGVAWEKLPDLALGSETRELLDLRAAAAKWTELHHQYLEGLREAPLEVQYFLKAASSDDGAPLSMLNKPISDWLEQAGATDNFVIRNR